ncbi:hypothetical protein D4764_11G0007150 [Takifugu flavidus]|uniref:Death domain-containing protein n=1 Tax=Takifugu flavidus TaxID=433684 RepID=A0A5C6PFM9_9TELE|nr:hypothetical protein D4764_11G0007150 [Takifugu flavidus]
MYTEKVVKARKAFSSSLEGSGFVVPSSSQCVDGTYKHDGRDCCLCAAGLYLMEHCTETLQYGKCETCKDDTYSSEPTSQMSCEPCRSCSQPNGNGAVKSVLNFVVIIFRFFSEVELYPHLPDIADIIGWKDMKDIAIASGITQVTIESVQLNHQNDHEEQTQELLNRFREKHGQEAAKKLIELLKTKGKNNKAVRVESLLRRAAGNVV